MWIRQIQISERSIIGKITSFIAPNVLSIYLIHNQHFMMAWLIAIGTPTALSLNVAQHFIYWCIYGIVVIVACTVIDKIRVCLWKTMHITATLVSFSNGLDKKIQFPAVNSQ